ncbi:hypothetical protein GCM10023330_08280 [Litoribaculum gwangyangense]|uniref:DUF2490 domain-containing protein n=2 Tax=Litoribaculum gwangyangense TaxID=1130722 RepID=A0ABP9C3Y8_9FLAO
MWVFSGAQESFRALAETSIAINHKVSKNYNVNFATRSRSFLYRNQTLQYQQQQLDIFHFSTLVLDYSHDLSFGIYYRNRDIFDTGSDELRLTQQFNYKKQKLGVRFGHRFRSEQRFFNDRTVFRQRYRFTIDFPLNGEKLDIGELYFVSSLEGLLNLSKPDIPEIDQRTTVQIGWQLTENLKLQAGLEYRLESFNVEAQNNLFVLSSGILKI